MFCKRCGAALEPDSRFCHKCGTTVEHSLPPTSKEKFRRSATLLILACTVLLAGLFGYHYYDAGVHKFRESLEKTAPLRKEPPFENPKGTTTDALIAPIEKQLQSLKAHDLKEAYEDPVSKEFKAETNFEHFQRFIHNYPILTTFQKYEFQSHSIKQDQAEVVVLLDSDKDRIPLNYHLVKEDGLWKIWQMQIVLPMSDGSFADPLEHPKQLLPVVEGLLNDLNKQKIEEAYENYTSSAFRQTTSKDVFNQFVLNYPIFKDFKSLTIHETVIINDQGKVAVDLSDSKGRAEILFSLVLEGEKWEIKGIQVSSGTTKPKDSPEVENEPINENTFLVVIDGQLQALKKKAVEDAYDKFTSKEFKSITSLDEFQKFLDSHSIFFEFASSGFPKLTFNNNVATMIGYLRGMNGRDYPLEYDLIQEDGQWKILHIQISKPIDSIKKSKNEP